MSQVNEDIIRLKDSVELDRLAHDELDWAVLHDIARNTVTRTDTLDYIFRKCKVPAVLVEIANNENTRTETLQALAEFDDRHVRIKVADNAKTSKETLAWLKEKTGIEPHMLHDLRFKWSK